MTNEEKTEIKNIAKAINVKPFYHNFFLTLLEQWITHLRIKSPFVEQLIKELYIDFAENFNKENPDDK